jgi:hypothetical protein
MKPCIQNLFAALVLFAGVHQATAQVNFAPTMNYIVGASPSSVAVADINGDGRLDLIYANANNNTLTALTNNGGGIFGSNATYSVGNFPSSVVAADIKGNGKVALICANALDRTLTVLTNNGNGVFGSNATYIVASSPASPLSIVAVDVNGDGKLDLVCGNHALFGSILILTNNGSGIFGSNATYGANGECTLIKAADVNGDGAPDIICLNPGSTPCTLFVLTNNGSGAFGSNATYAVDNFDTSSFVVADVNGDSKRDIVYANPFANTLSVLTNNGSGVFGSNATYTVSSPGAVTAADINGDGMPDLICANVNSNTVTVLTNNGSGIFGLASTNTVGGSPDSVITADVNNDGKLDLICANQSSNSLSVLINTSTFPPPATMPSLNIKRLGNDILVSWPSVTAGWSLQQNPDLTTINWSPSGYSGYDIADNGTNKNLTISPSAVNLFFRLLHP